MNNHGTTTPAREPDEPRWDDLDDYQRELARILSQLPPHVRAAIEWAIDEILALPDGHSIADVKAICDHALEMAK